MIKKKICINFSYFRFVKPKKERKVLLTSSECFLANNEKCLKEIINNMLPQIGILILNILIINSEHKIVNLKLLMFLHKTNIFLKIKEFKQFINTSNCWIVKIIYKLRYYLYYEQT
jgi:hypothetical protein